MSRHRHHHSHSSRPTVHALLIGRPQDPHSDLDARASLTELERLVAGLGIRIVGTVVPTRAAPGAILGAGKQEEVAALLTTLRRAHGDDVIVVVDGAPSPSQTRRLEQALEVEVVDRSGIILRVFAARARTRIARLEVELATLAYQLPRVRDDATVTARDGGGGGRGERGHSNVELAKQRLRERIADLRRELERARAAQDPQRERRHDAWRVALVGYTNAGKSSWMRALTGTDVAIDDRPFTTLDTTVRALAAPGPRILVSDTVGFVRDLPHELVASFRSTLDEAHEAALVLHVVDAADPSWREQLQISRDTLAAIGAAEVPARVVLNKVDRLDAGARAALAVALPDALCVSALDAGDVRRLRDAIVELLEDGMAEETLVVPFRDGARVGEIRAAARVLAETHTDAGTVLTVRAPAATIAAWTEALPPAPPIVTAAELLAEAGRHGLALTVEREELDHSGLDFLVANARDGGGVPWVVRTPRRPDVVAAARVEARALRLVRRRLPVAVPDWRLHARTVIAYPRLAGTPAVTVGATGPTWNIIEPTALPGAFLDSFADALAALRSIAPADAVRAGLPVVLPAQDRDTFARDAAATRAVLAPTPAVWARWQRWLADDALWPTEVALVHGDLHPGHMLLAADARLTGILDWTEARLTDPSVDLAMFFGCFGGAALAALLARLEARGIPSSPRVVEQATERWAAFPIVAAAWALRTGNDAVLEHARGHLAAASPA